MSRPTRFGLRAPGSPPVRRAAACLGTLGLLGGALGAAAGGCDAEGLAPGDGDLAVAAFGLTGGSCGAADPVGALADINSVTVYVSELDEDTGERVPLAQRTASVSTGSVSLGGIPEGIGLRVDVVGDGATGEWYAADPSVTVRRNETNTVDLLFSRLGGFGCVDTPTTFPNVVFPATVELGDGRVMITGGFTQLVDEAGASVLKGATDQAMIFDTRTGSVTNLGGMGQGQGRAGHTMVFVPTFEPGSLGRVLIYGGLTELEIDQALGFPLTMDKAKARNDYLVFDIATSTFSEGAGVSANDPKRGFPRAQRLADNTVVITGGGEWPLETASEYKDVEIYDPASNTLLNIQNFESFWPRSGHSLTFVGNSTDANSTNAISLLLVYGGTTTGALAELFVQSSAQLDSVNGTFQEVEVVGEAPRSYFHEMTAVGDQRFLLTGGVRYEGDTLVPAKDDEAYLMTFVDGATPRLEVQKVPGLGAGRFFHTAEFNARDGIVTVLGGLDGTSAIQTDQIRFFDVATQAWELAAETGQFAPRGAHSGLALQSGALALIGGEANFDALVAAPQRAFVEIYTPSHLRPAP